MSRSAPTHVHAPGCKDCRRDLLGYIDMFTTFARRNTMLSVEGFVKDNGCFLDSTPFTRAELKALYAILTDFGPAPARQCYETAFRTTFRAATLGLEKQGHAVLYGEGIATGLVIPVNHACMILNGKPVDLVWRENILTGDDETRPAKLVERARYNLAHHTYYMVGFTVEQMMRGTIRRGLYGIIDDFEHGYPLLTHGKEWLDDDRA